MFEIEYATSVAEDLRRLPARQRRIILDAIQEQLAFEPLRETHNRKLLVGLVPPWETVAPVWELRIGEYRVFYDVDVDARCVVVRCVRRKPPHVSTEDIL